MQTREASQQQRNAFAYQAQDGAPHANLRDRGLNRVLFQRPKSDIKGLSRRRRQRDRARVDHVHPTSSLRVAVEAKRGSCGTLKMRLRYHKQTCERDGNEHWLAELRLNSTS